MKKSLLFLLLNIFTFLFFLTSAQSIFAASSICGEIHCGNGKGNPTDDGWNICSAITGDPCNPSNVVRVCRPTTSCSDDLNCNTEASNAGISRDVWCRQNGGGQGYCNSTDPARCEQPYCDQDGTCKVFCETTGYCAAPTPTVVVPTAIPTPIATPPVFNGCQVYGNQSYIGCGTCHDYVAPGAPPGGSCTDYGNGCCVGSPGAVVPTPVGCYVGKSCSNNSECNNGNCSGGACQSCAAAPPGCTVGVVKCSNYIVGKADSRYNDNISQQKSAVAEFSGQPIPQIVITEGDSIMARGSIWEGSAGYEKSFEISNGGGSCWERTKPGDIQPYSGPAEYAPDYDYCKNMTPATDKNVQVVDGNADKNVSAIAEQNNHRRMFRSAGNYTFYYSQATCGGNENSDNRCAVQVQVQPLACKDQFCTAMGLPGNCLNVDAQKTLLKTEFVKQIYEYHVKILKDWNPAVVPSITNTSVRHFVDVCPDNLLTDDGCQWNPNYREIETAAYYGFLNPFYPPLANAGNASNTPSAGNRPTMDSFGDWQRSEWQWDFRGVMNGGDWNSPPYRTSGSGNNRLSLALLRKLMIDYAKEKNHISCGNTGYFDSVCSPLYPPPLRVRGWAFDANNPNTPITVEIRDDLTPYNVVATVVANKFRQDLRDANVCPNAVGGSGFCAFDDPFTPPSAWSTGNHTFTAWGKNATTNTFAPLPAPAITATCPLGYTLSGQLINDKNGDDLGSDGLYPGVNTNINITLTPSSGSPINATLDGVGNYSFNNVPAGVYTLSASIPGTVLNRYISTTVPLSKNIQSTQVQNLHIAYTYQIQGLVYNDISKNLKYEPGAIPPDTAYPNGTVSLTGTLLNAPNVSLGPINVAGTGGIYTFTGLKPLYQYTITYTPPSAPGQFKGYKILIPSFIQTEVGPDNCPKVPFNQSFDVTCDTTTHGFLGDLKSLNFPVTNSNPWVQFQGLDVRSDQGFANNIPTTVDNSCKDSTYTGAPANQGFSSVSKY